MNFSFADAFSLAITVIKEKFLKFLIMFLISTGMIVVTFYMFFNNLNNVIRSLPTNTSDISMMSIFGEMLGGGVWVMLLVLIVVDTILAAHVVTLVKSTSLGTEDHIGHTLSGIWYFIGGSFLLALAMFGIMIPFVLFAFIPILGILSLIGMLVVIFYFIGYYRFIPYLIFIKRSFDESFSESKRLLEGKFWQSIIIVIIFGLINIIINSSVEGMNSSIFQANYNGIIPTAAITAYIVAQVVATSVTYFQNLVDISFITLAIKADKEKRERELNKRKQQDATDDDYYQHYTPPKPTKHQTQDDVDSQPFNL